jgi:hypothetical protein
VFREYQKYVLYLKDCSVDCMTKNKEVCTNVGSSFDFVLT